MEENLALAMNFLEHPAKKVLLITGSVTDAFVDTLIQHTTQKQISVTYIDIAQQSDVAIFFVDLPTNLPLVFIFANSILENYYMRHKLDQWHAKAIIICNNSLLHPLLDSSLYFAPRKGQSIQKHLFVKLNFSPSNTKIPHPFLASDNFSDIKSKSKKTKIYSNLNNHYLNQRLLTKDIVMMEILADRIQHDDMYKAFFIKLVYASRNNEGMQIGAANAITALNYAKYVFSSMNLSNVKISGADLKCSLMDAVNFEHADLSMVDFRDAWLRNANFSDAILSEIKFNSSALTHPRKINGTAYNQDKALLITCSENTLYFWDLISESLSYRLFLTGANPLCIALSPNGQNLAIGTGSLKTDSRQNLYYSSVNYEKPTIDIYDISSKELIYTYNHDNDISCMMFSPNGLWLASGTTAGIIILKNMQSKKIIKLSYPQLIMKRKDFISCILDGTFDTDDYTLGSNTITTIHFSKDSKIMAVAGGNGNACIIDLETLLVINTQKIEKISSPSLQISPNKSIIAIGIHYSGAKEHAECLKNLIIWDLSTNKTKILMGNRGGISSLDFDSTGNYLATGGYKDKTILIWDINLLKQISHYSSNSPVRYLHFSFADTRLIAASTNIIRMHELKQTSYNQYIDCNRSDLSSDKKRFALACSDGKIRVWYMDNKRLKILNASNNSVIDVKLNPANSQQLASIDADGCVILWCLITNNKVMLLTYKDTLKTLAFSPNGVWLAWGTKSGVIYLYNNETNVVTPYYLFKNYIICLCFDPNNDILAIAADKEGVKLLTLSSGKIRTLQDLSCSNELINSVHRLYFNPNKHLKQLAEWNVNQTIRIWNVTTGQLEFKIDSYHDNGYGTGGVVFSNDGRWLATWNWKGFILLMNQQINMYFILPNRLWFDNAKHLSNGEQFGWMGWTKDVAFSTNNELLATIDIDGRTCIWDIKNFKLIFELKRRFILDYERKPYLFWLSHNELLIAGKDCRLELWRIDSQTAVSELVWMNSGYTALPYTDGCKLDGARYLSVINNKRLQDAGAAGQLLLNQRADWHPIHLACATGNINYVSEIMNKQPNAINLKTITDGFTPMHLAAQYRHLNIFLYLASKGADASEFDYEYNTPISIISQYSEFFCFILHSISLLIPPSPFSIYFHIKNELYKFLNHSNKDDLTFGGDRCRLPTIIEQKIFDLFEYSVLLRIAPLVNRRWYILSRSIFRSSSQLPIPILLEINDQTNESIRADLPKQHEINNMGERMRDNNTNKQPTMRIHSYKNNKCTFFGYINNILKRILNRYKLKREHTLPNIDVALRRASRCGPKEDVYFLLHFISDINIKDNNPNLKRTALHWAIIEGREDNAMILLAGGAHYDIEDAMQKTAKEYAADSSIEAIRKLFIITSSIDFYHNNK